jgi:hypothetical protein
MKVNKIKGGGLVENQIKQFLESSYAEFPPKILGVTNLYVKVYFSISDEKSYCYTSWHKRSIRLVK